MSKRTKGSSQTLRSSKGPSAKSRQRLRASLSKKSAAPSPVISESESEIDDRVTERLNTSFVLEEPTTPPSGIIPVSDTVTNPIVSTALSSTFSKWASKVVNNTDDHTTRQLLGQLARVIPLAGNSPSSSTTMTRNAIFDDAQKEAIRGLKKARDTESGSAVSVLTRAKAKSKGKGKAALLTFKVSSIIFLPCGTVKGPPPSASETQDEVAESDYIDTIANSKPPTEGVIQSLEEQRLAIRNMEDGYELDSTWDYDEIYSFLRPHFLFLFRYFEEGPNAESYKSSTPFIIVNKSYQTLVALPFKLNGDVLRRNSDTPTGKNGLQMRKLFFVTRHPIPISILTSWSKGKFIALPSSLPSVQSANIRVGQKKSGRQTSAKRKRHISSSSSSSDSVVIIEKPARKRRTGVSLSAESSGLEDTHHDSDATIQVNSEMDEEVVEDYVNNKEHAEKEVNIDSEWEEYDPTKFNSVSSAAGPSSSRINIASPEQAALTATASSLSSDAAVSHDSHRGVTPFHDDPVTSNLLSPSRSQRSFSNLNLENPYSADVDFGFDF